MDVLNILVLHSLGDENDAPFFLKHHVFMLRQYCPEHNYIYHDVGLPFPAYAHEVPFDLIVLDVTLLCSRWSSKKIFEQLKSDYSFVKFSNAVKIALPQDEYDCNEILDEWMVDWKVDIVYSVISEHWDILYPKFHKIGSIKLAFTGYIDETLIDWPRNKFVSRPIDIGYRARKLLPYFGRLGETKWTIARDVLLKTATEKHLKVDIKIGDKSALNGASWLEFINNSKFTLGSNSGSSLLDPVGKIQRKVRAFLLKDPNANFDEVEMMCFSGEDGKHEFTAISPRVMEASLLGSGQILVEGLYSGLITPWQNYIPIKSDASNWQEVSLAMKDNYLVEKMIENTRLKILDIKELRAREKAKKIISDASKFHAEKKVKSSSELMNSVIQRYKNDITPERYKTVWRKRRLRKRFIDMLDEYPQFQLLARKIYDKFR